MAAEKNLKNVMEKSPNYIVDNDYPLIAVLEHQRNFDDSSGDMTEFRGQSLPISKISLK